MSTEQNDEYLERAQEEFAEAENREERQAVVIRLREDGFDSQADYLAKFVEEGIDESF